MLALIHFALLLLLAAPTLAAPAAASFSIPYPDPDKILCQLPIVKQLLCPPTGQAALNRRTALGIAQGTQDPTGAYRFTVKYANAERWKPSTLVSAWQLPYVISNLILIVVQYSNTALGPPM